MPARRCTLCGISYPSLTDFRECPVHGEQTQLVSNIDPDENWQAQMELQIKQAERDAAGFAPVPLVPGVQVTEDKGLLWVSNESLHLNGAKFNSAFGGFKLFELEDGWIYETQGWDNPGRRWWVERVIRSEEAPSPPTTSAVARSSTESATS